MRIVDKLAARQTYSLEIFPPKGEMPLEDAYEISGKMATTLPDWISVTYSAGGSGNGPGSSSPTPTGDTSATPTGDAGGSTPPSRPQGCPGRSRPTTSATPPHPSRSRPARRSCPYRGCSVTRILRPR